MHKSTSSISSKPSVHSSRIVFTSILGNLSEQVGVPPRVGSGYGHFEVLGGGV